VKSWFLRTQETRPHFRPNFPLPGRRVPGWTRGAAFPPRRLSESGELGRPSSPRGQARGHLRRSPADLEAIGHRRVGLATPDPPIRVQVLHMGRTGRACAQRLPAPRSPPSPGHQRLPAAVSQLILRPDQGCGGHPWADGGLRA